LDLKTEYSLEIDPQVPQHWKLDGYKFGFKPAINHDEAGRNVDLVHGTSDNLLENASGFLSMLTSPTYVQLGAIRSDENRQVNLKDYIAEVIWKLPYSSGYDRTEGNCRTNGGPK